jgi:hypothetical protein
MLGARGRYVWETWTYPAPAAWLEPLPRPPKTKTTVSTQNALSTPSEVTDSERCTHLAFLHWIPAIPCRTVEKPPMESLLTEPIKPAARSFRSTSITGWRRPAFSGQKNESNSLMAKSFAWLPSEITIKTWSTPFPKSIDPVASLHMAWQFSTAYFPGSPQLPNYLPDSIRLALFNYLKGSQSIEGRVWALKPNSDFGNRYKLCETTK